MPDSKKVEISNIFNWFKGDFDKVGGVNKILAKYAPRQDQDFLTGGNYEISYLPYNWGLNDQGDHGKNYSENQRFWDSVFNFIQFWK
jgi:hypothetical protein